MRLTLSLMLGLGLLGGCQAVPTNRATAVTPADAAACATPFGTHDTDRDSKWSQLELADALQMEFRGINPTDCSATPSDSLPRPFKATTAKRVVLAPSTNPGQTGGRTCPNPRPDADMVMARWDQNADRHLDAAEFCALNQSPAPAAK